MNHITKIGLFLTILMIESIGHAGDNDSRVPSLYSYNQSTDDTFEDSNTYNKLDSHQNEMSDDALRDQINDFIARSYISPRLQNTIFQIYNKPFTLNETTRRPVLLDEKYQPSDWPTIDEILNQQLSLQDLQSLQEVIGIAINFAVQHFAFHATHNALLIKQTTAQETTVMEKLREYKTNIEKLMTVGKFSNKTSTPFTQEQILNINEKLQGQNIVSYSTDHVQKNFLRGAHDFKQVIDASAAAQLLFKQCYTAQNGILVQRKPHDIVQHLIDQAIKKHKHSQSKIHDELVKIAIAAKTALSIAENEYGQSWYNPARYNPFGSKHSLIRDLEAMYQEVDKELIKKENGASDADINRKYYIDLAQNIATGIFVTAAVIGTVATAKYTYDNADVIKIRAENAYESTKDTVLNAPSTMYQAASKIAQSGYDATLGKLVGTVPTTSASTLLQERVEQAKAKEERAAQELQKARDQLNKAQGYPDKSAQQIAEKTLNEKNEAYKATVKNLHEQQKKADQIADAQVLASVESRTVSSQALAERINTFKKERDELDKKSRVAVQLKQPNAQTITQQLERINERLQTTEQQLEFAQARETLEKKQDEYQNFTKIYNPSNPLHVAVLKKEAWELDNAQNNFQKAKSGLYQPAQTESKAEVVSQSPAAPLIAAPAAAASSWFSWSSNTPVEKEAPAKKVRPLLKGSSKSEPINTTIAP